MLLILFDIRTRRVVLQQILWPSQFTQTWPKRCRVRRHFDEVSCRYPRTLYHCEIIKSVEHSLDLPLGSCKSLHWRYNDHDDVSNHQPHGCLLNRLFRRRSKKTSKLRVTGLCVRNSPGPVNSPHKGPVTRKMFPFDDVIMASVKLRMYYVSFLLTDTGFI